jgi:nucleosome binding factor SPN SPT16 subunit
VSKVEVAVFERMIANVRNFDLTFVFRDYETNIRVQSIPIDSLEKIKDWLDSSDIIFYEIQKNLTWATFLSSIRKDFQKFVEDGAWTAWDSDDEDGEEEEGGEDSAFEIESVEEDDSESESESNYEEDEDEESGSYSEESLSEEGLDSEEMDEEF